MTSTLTAPVKFTTLTGKVVNPGQVTAADLSMKRTGATVSRVTGAIIGNVTRAPHPTRVGTTIFTATHVDGTLVYCDVYKREALASLAKHHNSIITAVVPTVFHGQVALRPGEAAGKTVRHAIQHPKLSDEELYALSSYTGSSYKSMSNHVLQGDASVASPHIREQVKHLAAAVERSVVTAPLAVLRSFPQHTALRVFGTVGSQVGETFTERRFTSTTTSGQPVGSFGVVRVHYHVTPGARALEVNRHGGNHHDEYEVIMPPGQRYRILADRVVAGERVMEMETVTDDAS